ncbi:MAG: alpha/beta fold hydrolase [Hyphomonadaceae bacterium]|nr:alpha/beta fold hydrolase [Hyphomonadaceae bacterium]
MTRALDWNVEGRDWPNREASRFVESGGLRWHVQVMGEGPKLVLLHGTGASTHSWRDVAPLLAKSHTVVALDLPGHGFTAMPARRTDFALPQVARGVTDLLGTLDVSPAVLIGHSAGAAIAVRMALDGAAPRQGIVGINAALLPFPGPIGPLAPMLARMLFYNPATLGLFAYRAGQRGAIKDLLHGTGSSLDAIGLALYERLFRNRAHLEGTVALMSHWGLNALQRELPKLKTPLTLIVGDKDRAVRPDEALTVQVRVKHARIATAKGYGHLAHEEAPALITDLIHAALHQTE